MDTMENSCNNLCLSRLFSLCVCMRCSEISSVPGFYHWHLFNPVVIRYEIIFWYQRRLNWGLVSACISLGSVITPMNYKYQNALFITLYFSGPNDILKVQLGFNLSSVQQFQTLKGTTKLQNLKPPMFTALSYSSKTTWKWTELHIVLWRSRV